MGHEGVMPNLLPLLYAIVGGLIVQFANFLFARVGKQKDRLTEWYDGIDTWQARADQRLDRIEMIATNARETEQRIITTARELEQRINKAEERLGLCEYKVGLVFRQIEDNLTEMFIQKRER